MTLATFQPLASVLVSSAATPLPPQEVVQGLARISPRIKIEWCRGAHVPYWGLKVQWGPEDPRWERVRTGEVPPDLAFDLEQMFPRDCSTEEMVAYVENRWGERNRLGKADAAQEAERIVRASQAATSTQRQENTERVVQASVEKSAKESSHGRLVRAGAESAHPMVPGGLTK